MYPLVEGRFAYNVELYYYGMKATQIVGTLFNLFTIFMIWKYSAIKMKEYRIHLLWYQLGSAGIDFGMNTLAQPLFFFPYLAGSAQGVLSTLFGLHTYMIFILMAGYIIICHYFVGYHLLFYRWQLIIPDEHKFKIKSKYRRMLLEGVFCIGPGIGIMIFFYPAMESYELNYSLFRELNPSDANLTLIQGFYCVGAWSRSLFYYGMAFIALCLFLLFVTVFYYIGSCNRVLKNSSGKMSQRTKRMHFRFLKMLLFQVGIPLILIQLPIIIWGVKARFGLVWGGQDFNNFMVWIICIHGWVGSFFLLCMNRCYKDRIKEVFFHLLKLIVSKCPSSCFEAKKKLRRKRTATVLSLTKLN